MFKSCLLFVDGNTKRFPKSCQGWRKVVCICVVEKDPTDSGTFKKSNNLNRNILKSSWGPDKSCHSLAFSWVGRNESGEHRPSSALGDPGQLCCVVGVLATTSFLLFFFFASSLWRASTIHGWQSGQTVYTLVSACARQFVQSRVAANYTIPTNVTWLIKPERGWWVAQT